MENKEWFDGVLSTQTREKPSRRFKKGTRNGAASAFFESLRLAHDEAAAVQERQTKDTDTIRVHVPSLLPNLLFNAPSSSLTRNRMKIGGGASGGLDRV